MSAGAGEPPESSSSLEEDVRRWRAMDGRLRDLRRHLEDEGREAVPSYRIGTAEGFTVFDGLGLTEEVVGEGFENLSTDLQRRRKEEQDGPTRGRRASP